MEDIRGPDYELAENDYIKGMKYKDIAEKYNVSINTVKSWKTRYKWNRDGVHTDKKVCTQDKKNASKKVEPIAEEVKEVLENTNLTEKQRLFCIYYIKYFNATKAALKAGYSKDTAYAIGYENLNKPQIKAEIQRLKVNKLNRAMLSEDDIFQKYIDIAFADISDYVTFGRKEIEVAKDEDNNPVMIEVNYVDFKNSSEIDGTIISEVSQGKNGVSVKLQDKMKALQWLSDRMDLLSAETKIKIDNEKSKVQMAREKLDFEKAKAGGDNNSNDGVLKEMLEGLKDGI